MKRNIRTGFTIVEVSILFVIFLIVAFLVAPLSLDDTMQAKNTSRWRNVQSDFSNIFYSINTQKENEGFVLSDSFISAIGNDIREQIEPYKITFMNGTFPSGTYRFNDFHETVAKAVVSYKLFQNTTDGLYGVLMSDVNGIVGPNVWGKDVFGYNIYSDRFEPFCKNDPVSTQKQDCSKAGTGLCCSNYYLIGGSFN